MSMSSDTKWKPPWWAVVACVVFGPAGFGYGFMMGSVTQYTTFEKDQQACTALCKPNGGVEKCYRRVTCTCENGAMFSESDWD